MSLTITVLGCGNSEGTPAIGNDWGKCDPDEPRNRRTRPCIAVQSKTTTLIIDTGPDFRSQINDANITDIDAVLYTHAHSDHINGADDLRAFSKRRDNPVIDVYATQSTYETLLTRFPYQFREITPLYPQVMEMNIINPEQFGKPMTVGDITFTPFEQEHGTCKSLGFRFDDLAYCTDVADLDDTAIETLSGIKTLIIDGAGHYMQRNIAHYTIPRIIDEIIPKLTPEHTYLTHLSVYMDYKTLCDGLPSDIKPAYDGLILQTGT